MSKKINETKSKKLNQSKEKSSSINMNIKKWSLEEDKILSNLIINHKYKNWKIISSKLPGHTAMQCQNRWNKNLKPGLVKGPWSVQEDKLLTEWVNKNGPKKWNQCCEFIHGRSGKQCREHWNNCLNPNLIKGEWTPEEDFLIMYFYQKYNGSWKNIINLFHGRTENSIKNRFFSQLRKIASSNLSSAEKKYTSKIRLEDLKNYLNIGIENSKNRFLKEKPMNEEELNNFLNKIEQKIKIKKLKSKDSIEENDNYETCFSTNLSNLENSQNLIKKNKEINFTNKKRKRSKDKELKNDLYSIEENEKSEIESSKIDKEKIKEKNDFEKCSNNNKNEKEKKNEENNTSNIIDNNKKESNVGNNIINSNNINNMINNNNINNMINSNNINNIINNNILEKSINNNNDFNITNNNYNNNDFFINNNNFKQESNFSFKNDNSEFRTELNDFKSNFNQFNENNNNNINENMNMNYQMNNYEPKLNENNTSSNNNSSQSIKKLDSINIYHKSNIIVNNFINLFGPNKTNISLFDNYKYEANKYFPVGNLIFNHVDSQTDLQTRLSSNMFNYTSKPSTTSFNGNKVIDNDIEFPLKMNNNVNIMNTITKK